MLKYPVNLEEPEEIRSEAFQWLLSIPPVPRLLLAVLCGFWWIYFTVGIYIEDNASPQQVWWLDVWTGGLGGNSFSAFGASVLAIVLTKEVFLMVFTLGAYLRQKEAAKKAAEAADRAAEAAREETRLEERHEWEKWLDSVRDDLEAGRPPSVPPPANGDSPRGS